MKKEYRDRYAAQAKELVSQMTLEERASMLCMEAPAIERLGLPAYHWWNEGLHGVARAGTATVFPQAIGLAATFDTGLLRRVGSVIGYEGRIKYNLAKKQNDRTIYKGLTFWSPNINIYRDPRWGRGQETYGEDPVLTAECAKGYIAGVEDCPDERYKLASACLKHMAAHSGPEEVRHGFNSVVSDFDLNDTYLPAFREVVTTVGVDGVMGAYNMINGVHSCGNRHLMNDVLREEWGFDGYYVSDCGALADMHEFCLVTHTAVESAALALHSGCDLNCGQVFMHVLEAYRQGMVTEEEITRSAERNLAIRLRLGMRDGEDCPYDSYTDIREVDGPAHRAVAYDAAVKSCVLLKNNGVLPLDKGKLKTVAVIGPNAASVKVLEGNYNGTSSRYVTILDGIQQECGNDVRVLYAKGCPLFETVLESCSYPRDGFSEAIAAAEAADAVIMAVGIDASIEGEQGDAHNTCGGGDKLDLRLPGLQPELLRAVKATGKPLILVVLAGGALDLSWADKNADAILFGWYPGCEGGHAIADLLFGNANPSGRTPVTFYRSVNDLPPFEDYNMEGRTYRYLKTEPLYPFGHGLAYTSFAKEFTAEGSPESGFVLTVRVKNTGERAGETCVPVFAHYGKERYRTPNKKLCGFGRVSLAPGEEKEIRIEVEPSSLLLTDKDGTRYLPENAVAFELG